MRRCLVPPARVLVRMPSWLGDFVMAEPVVRALHEAWSRASCVNKLTLVGPARFLALLRHLERDGARFVPLERGVEPDARTWRGHDVALILDGSWRSVRAAWSARIPERVGFAGGGRAALLTQWIVPARERGGAPLGIGTPGAWPRRLPRPFTSACVELAGVCGLPVRERAPRLQLDADALERVRARIERSSSSRSSRRVLVHAGARPGSAKGVPPEQWVGLLHSLGETDACIVVTCAPGEEALARDLRDRLPRAILLDDPPLDLSELLAVHELCDRVLTSDSGTRHLAQAAGRAPVVVLCGPTDPRHTSEHAPSVRVRRVEVACGPCHRETCPLHGDGRHACMAHFDPRASPAVSATRDEPLVRVVSRS